MIIGLLGGAFNPPHIGHILMAQQTLEFTDVDQVWWLPAYQHTFEKQMDASEQRLAMVRLLNLDKCQVSTLEIDYRLNGETINLLPLLKKHFPQDRFTFVMGSDQLPRFTEWGNWQELVKELPFLIIPRAGFSSEPLYANMTVLSHPLLVINNISSTLIRERVKKELSIEHLVTREVREYIEKHGLYKL